MYFIKEKQNTQLKVSGNTRDVKLNSSSPKTTNGFSKSSVCSHNSFLHNFVR